jgi:hypothetical protein
MLCQECKAVLKQPMTLNKESSGLDFLVANFQHDISLVNLQAKAKRCCSCQGILRQIVKDDSPWLQGKLALQIHYSHGVVANRKSTNPWLHSSIRLNGSVLGVTRMHFEKVKDKGVWNVVPSCC